jgi:arylsulfatase
MQGRSIAGVLSGAQPEVYGADDYIGGEMQNGKWMRQGDFKAASVAPPFGDGQWALYNVVEDPGETQDLSNEQRQTLDRLIEAWDRYAANVGVVLMEQ